MDLTIIGAGMFTHDVVLPAMFQLQRDGVVGRVRVCATRAESLQTLRDDRQIREAFPGQDFEGHTEGYAQVLAGMAPRQLVAVVTPDHLHHAMVMAALQHDQHVLCVKPLVQKFAQAEEIRVAAQARGLLVGVEYHKRFDRRALIARRDYAAGRFGTFVMGEARLVEPYYYRASNFQNWFTCEQADPFTYVGCHYVDLVAFITGLRPVEVSVRGVKGKFPNGNEGFMWSQARVVFENGGVLSVVNGLGYPDAAAGSNDQGMTLYTEGKDGTGMIAHDDQFRGVEHSYAAAGDGKAFRYINPDFFRYVPRAAGNGAQAVGYGFDSVAAIVQAAGRVEAANDLAGRQAVLGEIDAMGLIATPGNSGYNELVVEAARKSILQEGRAVRIGGAELTISD